MGCNPLKCNFCGMIIPQRYILVLFISLAIIICYGQRVNFNMIIAEMSTHGNSSDQCSEGKNKTGTSPTAIQWDQSMQALALSGFFIGYVIMQVPGGYMGDRWGARYILTTSLLVSSICTILFCVVIDYTPFVVVVIVRIVIGLAQASLFPNATTLLSRWIPPEERTTVGGITFAAGALGIILGKLVAGLVYVLADDWRPVFYIWGGFGMGWYILAMMYLFSGPNSHPFISENEKKRLEEDIIPWDKDVKLKVHKMLFDPAVIALLMGQFGHDYLIFFLTTSMAKYFTDVLDMQMKDNMLAASLPYSLMWLSSVVTGYVADRSVRRGANVALVRKSYTTIASVLPSICMVIIPYAECNLSIVVTMMCLSLLTMGPFFAGLKVNVMDISQNYSGVLMAIVNAFGGFAGIISPHIIALFASNHEFSEWKIVMWVIFGVATITNIIYIVFGKGERRKWDMNEDDKEESRLLKEEMKEEKKRKAEAKKAAKKR